jgi:hypothetical protein
LVQIGLGVRRAGREIRPCRRHGRSRVRRDESV